MFRSVVTRSLRQAAQAALVVAAVGCAQDSTLGPQSEFKGRAIIVPPGERPWILPGLQSGPSDVTVLVSAVTGGTVSMGRFTLEFPPGALEQDTEITMKQADPEVMIVELGPHGIQFNLPVTFSAQVGDLVDESTQTVGIAWFNESTSKWEVVAEEQGPVEVVEAGLWHFSSYQFFEN